MEPSKEAISVRIKRLHNLFLGQTSNAITNKQSLSREGLLDALNVLYNECNNDNLKKDRNIGLFVDKYRGIVLELRSLRVNINDFEAKNIIGRGHFGEVKVVREKHTGDVYAMKTLRKSDTLSHQAAAFFEEERDIMAYATSPWLTSLQYAFQDSNNLYLVMEFHPGGDLLALLDRFDNRLSEDMSRFYLAELVLAMKSLHSMGYVHRDIKPDNILLDRCGHLKLADFGSAAKLTSAGCVISQMPVGTPEYIAPEVLRANENNGDDCKKAGLYGIECDYWSLGIVAYELVLGKTPFGGGEEGQLMDTYCSIMSHKTSLQFPAECPASTHFQDVVSGLLEDSGSRLGHDQLIKHKFFREIDWNNIRNTVPPFVPVVNGEDDTSNFVEFDRRIPVPSIEDYKTRKQFSGRDLPFIGFTFSHEVASDARSQDNSFVDRRAVKVDVSLANKKKEIDELQKKLYLVEHGSKDRNLDLESLKLKLEVKLRLLDDARALAGSLEQECEKAKKENSSLKRTLEIGREEQRAQEAKALAMIRDMKTNLDRKRKEDVDRLSLDVEMLAAKIAELCSVNEKLGSKLRKREEEVAALKDEREEMSSLVQVHNDKMTKARNLSRQSVTGAEHQMDQVKRSYKKQLADVEESLEREQRKRAEELESHNAELKKLQLQLDAKDVQMASVDRNAREQIQIVVASRLALESKIEELTDAREKNSAAEKAKEREISDVRYAQLEDKLRKERSKCRDIKARLASMEAELSESMMSMEAHETTVAARDMEREEQYAVMTTQLKRATDEKCKLQARLQQAKLNEADASFKVNNLETLIKQFERGLLKLEAENDRLKAQNAAENSRPNAAADDASDVQRQVMEAQVERLEEQLEKSREAAILDRKAKAECESKLWKIEKELSDAKIDQRIAQRETKTAEEEIKSLKEEKKKLQDKMANDKTYHEKDLAALKSDLVDSKTSLEETQAKLDDSINKHKFAVRLLEDSKVALEKMRKESEEAAETSRSLQVKLEESARKVKALEEQNKTLKRENADLRKQAAEAVKNERVVANLNKEQELNYANLQTNVNLLKDTCAMLEEQLEDYEKLANTYEAKEKELTKDKLDFRQEIETLSRDLSTARQATNEEKSLRLRSEQRVKMLEADVAAKVEDLASLESQVADHKVTTEQLVAQINDLEDSCSAEEVGLRNARRMIEALQSQSNAIKEERTQQLTQIHSLKESNFELTKSVDSSAEEISELRETVADLKDNLEELQAFYKHREFKTNATLEQQTKLIDFLQRKVEEAGRKKKTLTEKLFGTHQKENMPLQGIGFKDLENMLSQEREKSQTLTEKLMKAQAELVCQKNDRVVDVISARAVDTLRNKKEMSRLVQSPGTQSTEFKRQHSVQRMHHNIPHRFELRLCMRATKCTACLDSIHFGRNAATCQECNITAHPKCSLILPTTCGLPLGFARHFSQSLRDGQCGDGPAVGGGQAPVKMEGYVKLPQRGKSCWERKYLVLDGSTLRVYEHKPAVNMVPVDTFEVCPPNGAASILSAVPYADVVNTAKSDLPYILKIVVSPLTTCWPGNSMLIMTLSFPDKQAWGTALESVVEHSKALPTLNAAQASRHQGTTVLALDRDHALDVNCVYQLSPALMLLGANEGLFSLRLNEKNAAPVKVAGMLEVHQIALVPTLGIAIMIEGVSRTLVQCDLRQLIAAAEAAECSHASLVATPVLVPTTDAQVCCHLFAVATTNDSGHHARTVLCAATTDKLILLTWSINVGGFNVIKVLDTSEPCSCIHFTPHSILVGSNKFFEIDLRDFSADEFLDSADHSLANACVNAQQLNSFPVAIVDVSKSRTDLEYLLCFNEFAVFVDKYGQRSREQDVKWSHMPFAFAYRKPYLFIFHFASVEVVKLSASSFTRSGDATTVNYPDQTFIELANPRYLGPSDGPDSIYLSHVPAPHHGLRLARMEGRLACKEDVGYSCSSLDTIDEPQTKDSADLNGCSSSEFSFTSSLVQSLDGSDYMSDDPSLARGTNDRRVHFNSQEMHTEL